MSQMACESFSQITTCEREIGSLLIRGIQVTFNTHNYGHQAQLRVAIYYLLEAVRISQT